MIYIVRKRQIAAKKLRLRLERISLIDDFDFAGNPHAAVEEILPIELLNSIPRWRSKLFVWGPTGELMFPTLHFACSTLSVPVIDWVLNTRVPLDQKDSKGLSPLGNMLSFHRR